MCRKGCILTFNLPQPFTYNQDRNTILLLFCFYLNEITLNAIVYSVLLRHCDH